MKQLLFRWYLVIQGVLRESGWMRRRRLWKISRWFYRTLRCGDVITAQIAGRHWALRVQDEFFTQGMILKGDHEEWEVPVFLEWLAPGMTVVDVGAHVGYYSLLSSERVRPSGRVIAFEPDTGNRELLLRNLAANHCRNVQVVPKALADHPGQGRLFLNPRNLGAHSIIEPEDPHVSSQIEMTTLDGYFADTNVKIDALKVDVEGAEFLVWRGMRRLLNERRISRIFIEIWPGALQRFGCTLEQLEAEIGASGF